MIEPISPHVDVALSATVTDELAAAAPMVWANAEYHTSRAPCGSPIEHAFLFAFFGLAALLGTRITPGWLCEAEGDCWYVEPQATVENYRVDFLICAFGVRLVVECDGHSFHERTKEQAWADRRRDRRLQELGFLVFRFTGSEIHRSPLECAAQVWNLLEDRASRPPRAKMWPPRVAA